MYVSVGTWLTVEHMWRSEENLWCWKHLVIGRVFCSSPCTCQDSFCKLPDSLLPPLPCRSTGITDTCTATVWLYMGSGDSTQVLMFTWQLLYSLSYLPSQESIFLTGKKKTEKTNFFHCFLSNSSVILFYFLVCSQFETYKSLEKASKISSPTVMVWKLGSSRLWYWWLPN